MGKNPISKDFCEKNVPRLPFFKEKLSEIGIWFQLVAKI
jgi:hypothetical protein